MRFNVIQEDFFKNFVTLKILYNFAFADRTAEAR